MSAIPFTSGNYRSRVDGTLVLSVEIEPQHRNDALKLFGSPGTSGALAALKDGHAKKSDKAIGEPAEPIGPLCMWAVQRCDEGMFRAWLSLKSGLPVSDEAAAKALICRDCGIKSRRELDTDNSSAARFDALIRKPYAQWLKSQGVG